MVENSLVLDASVIAKWLLEGEEDTVKALKIKDIFREEKIKIFVTSHFYSEICNTIFRKKPEDALNFFVKLKTSKIIEHRASTGTVLIAFELMQKYPKISFYDALYHAIAIYEDCRFITADERYYETTKKEGHVTLLKNY